MLSFVCIEGSSLALYTLGACISTNLLSIEAILKYFLINSFSSSLMAFSISLIFGIFGSLDFHLFSIIAKESLLGISQYGLYFIFFVFLSGLFFKLALFPFN